jgi:surfeit locus 1 family protein
MTWQLGRLEWKEALIATLEARLAAAPAPLPVAPDPAAEEFRRVTVTGRFTGAAGAHGFADAAYLTTRRPDGPGYRVVQPFETADGRTILVDRGYVPLDAKNEGGRAARPTPAPDGALTLTGALRWPQEADFFAGEGAGPADNVWLTRSVARLAPLWGAEPLLVVAETPTAPEGRWPDPMPVTVDLPNDHREYAITWGALAAVWAAMGALLVRREARRAAAAR